MSTDGSLRIANCPTIAPSGNQDPAPTGRYILAQVFAAISRGKTPGARQALEISLLRRTQDRIDIGHRQRRDIAVNRNVPARPIGAPRAIMPRSVKTRSALLIACGRISSIRAIAPESTGS